MGYLNESKRVKQADGFNSLEIQCNDQFVLRGDNVTVCMVWNNLIGANFDDEKKHLNYLKFLQSQGFKNGNYTIVGDGKEVIQACKINYRELD